MNGPGLTGLWLILFVSTMSCSGQISTQKRSIARSDVYFLLHIPALTSSLKICAKSEIQPRPNTVQKTSSKTAQPSNSPLLQSHQNIADNFYNDRVLYLPLPEFLGRIGEILNEEAHFEGGYEEGCEATFEYVHEDFDAEGVPMEIET